jgi:cyclopropane fatty-acyl-phospholipid synthase-like methyltransferase
MNVIDRALLNHDFPGSTWGNLGLWTDAQDYPAACEALAAKLAQSAQLQPDCSVLDVGFGYGDQLLLWKVRFGVGRITGVETDAEGIAEARRKLDAFNDVTLHRSGGDLHLTDERYDRVLALDCAYHFAPRSAFFAHAFQTLKPAGVLALTDIVVADGATSAQHARLARVCGIPPENLLTQTAYRQALTDLGFCNVRFETLDEEVLSGFSRFAVRLLRRRTFAALSAGGLKVLATAAIIGWLLQRRRVHYVLISAERPS